MTASGPRSGPRRDTRGIVDAAELFTRVRFRRHEPARQLRPYVDNYWFIDWELSEPYASHVVPHPSVNVVFERQGEGSSGTACGEVAGIAPDLFTKKLTGVGRVRGVKFRPGGFRPFAPGRPVSAWTGRRVPLDEVFAGAGNASVAAVLTPETDHARVAALDTFLLAHGPEPDPQADQAMALVDLVRTDRTIRRVSELARARGLSSRSLQRLFSHCVGVGPKWVILRHRIHEALERAEATGTTTATGSTGSVQATGSARTTGPAEATVAGGAWDWAGLAAELGYSDQAHLVRDFTATVGVPPTAYARRLSAP